MSEECIPCNERRKFLRTAAIAAAGTVTAVAVQAQEQPAAAPAATTRTLNLQEHTELQTVGGWKLVQNGDEKIIVVRTDANSFAACSAICTHKACEVQYKPESKQFVCPCHGARFDLQGEVVRGPAKKPLPRYEVDAAALVHLTPASKAE